MNQSIPIKDKSDQGMNGDRFNYIRARRADTSRAWINSIFLVMNPLILPRIYFALVVKGIAAIRAPLSRAVEILFGSRQAHPARRCCLVADGNVLSY